MEKVNLNLFYRLGAHVSLISHYDQTISRRFEFIWTSYETLNLLNQLMVLFPTLAVCRQPGAELNAEINALIEWWNKSKEEDKLKEDPGINIRFSNVMVKAVNFETILAAEVHMLSTYYAPQKGIYLTADLIDTGERIFPPNILSKLSGAVIEEVRSSGRCLAFDNGTASAFHMMRAVESVMHLYYIQICKPKPKPQKRLSNWGEYIKEFQKSANPKVKEVISLVQQLKDRHRNLIMHPDVVLTPEESFTLFEISQGIIIAMADELPVRTR